MNDKRKKDRKGGEVITLELADFENLKRVKILSEKFKDS